MVPLDTLICEPQPATATAAATGATQRIVIHRPYDKRSSGHAERHAFAQLLEVVPQHRLTWHGNAGADWLFAGDREFLIEETDGGAVSFTHVENVRGALVPLFRLIMASAIQRHHHGLNTALKQRAEELAAGANVHG